MFHNAVPSKSSSSKTKKTKTMDVEPDKDTDDRTTRTTPHDTRERDKARRDRAKQRRLQRDLDHLARRVAHDLTTSPSTDPEHAIDRNIRRQGFASLSSKDRQYVLDEARDLIKRSKARHATRSLQETTRPHLLPPHLQTKLETMKASPGYARETERLNAMNRPGPSKEQMLSDYNRRATASRLGLPPSSPEFMDLLRLTRQSSTQAGFPVGPRAMDPVTKFLLSQLAPALSLSSSNPYAAPFLPPPSPSSSSLPSSRPAAPHPLFGPNPRPPVPFFQ